MFTFDFSLKKTWNTICKRIIFEKKLNIKNSCIFENQQFFVNHEPVGVL